MGTQSLEIRDSNIAYPATKTLLTDPNGTSLLTSPDHAALHTSENDTIEAIEDVLGTNAGTSVLKNFIAGDFPARINSSNVLQQRVSGTIDNAIAGTPALSAGTWANAQLIGTSQITGGTVASALVGTSQITGGTITSATIITPSITTFSTLYLPQGGMVNGKIVTSVSSNNLTVALKGVNGNDPSATNPVYIRIGSGSDSVRAVTGALSVTLNAGTNYFNSGAAVLAALEVDYFVYASWDSSAGAVRLCFARIPWGRIGSDFSATNTAESYIARSDTLNAGDEVEVIGRFNATLSAAAGHNWSIPATSIVINRPIFETRILSWTAAWSCSGSMAISAGTVNYTNYQFVGRKLLIFINRSAFTLATSADTDIYATLPYSSSRSAANNMNDSNPIRVTDGGVNKIGFMAIKDTTPATLLIRNTTEANWTLGTTNQYVNGQGIIEV